MLYEWDPAKARSNLRKHGVQFADSVAALEDESALTIRDPDSTGEERWTTIGMDAFSRVLVLIYTWRSENLRVISCRKATASERRQYSESL